MRAPHPLYQPLQPKTVSAAIRLPSDSCLFFVAAICLGTYVLEGGLRYALHMVGLPSLIYLRDVLVVGSISFILVRSLLLRGQIEPAIALPLCALVAHTSIGIANGLSIFQILFGGKIVLATLFGVALWSIVRDHMRWMLLLVWLFFAVTVVGVVTNALIGPFPWEGQVYDTAFGAVLASREWWSDGTRRLPGLARASYDAALVAGLCGAVIMATCRSLPLRMAVATVALGVVVLTTTKGMMLALSLTSLWLMPWGGRLHLHSGRIVVGALLALSCTVPVMIALYGIAALPDGREVPAGLASLWERMEAMWPAAFDMIESPVQALFGVGIGAIGMPQTVSASSTPLNAADNIFVYYYISFGIMSIVYLAMPVVLASRVMYSEDIGSSRAFLAILMIAYGYGVTTNMIEQPFFSFFYGLAYGAALSKVLPRSTEHHRANS